MAFAIGCSRTAPHPIATTHLAAAPEPLRIELPENATEGELIGALHRRAESAPCYVVVGGISQSNQLDIAVGDRVLRAAWVCDQAAVVAAVRGRAIGIREWLFDAPPSTAFAIADYFLPIGAPHVGQPSSVSFAGPGRTAAAVIDDLRRDDVMAVLSITGPRLEIPGEDCNGSRRASDDVVAGLRPARSALSECVRGQHGILTVVAIIDPSGAVDTTVRDSQMTMAAEQCVHRVLRALRFAADAQCPTPITWPMVAQ